MRPGERLGRFLVEEVIGTGAFATVVRARDERLETTVAVKVLAENHSLDASVRERFLTEGRVLRRIDSPHVVAVHDLGETDRQQPFLVLEYADRGTLQDRLSRLRGGGWAPDADDLLAIARPLAAAVQAVHRAGVVHRDLSPGNVLFRSTLASTAHTGRLVGADERVLLADLGLCKDLARHSGLTVAAGTSGFRPPEQEAALGSVDHRADLWSLSALLWWVATGRSPAEEGTSMQGLPGGLEDVLRESLVEDPGQRHDDVAAWLSDVEAVLAPAPVRPALSPGPTRSPNLSESSTPTGPPTGTSWRSRTAITVVAALVGALAALWVVRPAGPTVFTTDDGRTTVQREVGDALLGSTGPTSVDVGGAAVFEIVAEGLDSWVWIAPDGRSYPDEPSLQVRVRSPGRAEVLLVGRADDGRRIEVVRTLTADE